MANAHSTVNYIEPNDINAFDDAIVNDGRVYSKIPSLEDFCIAMNLEVEVFNRSKKSTQGGNNEVLVLCWESNSNGESKVNFMSGKRILTAASASTNDSQNPPYLTTNPSDMYLDDLVDYGTTEMVGIKSVNVEYQSGSVPIINMKLTDVRGMSMFQPAEMMRDSSYLGVKGITSENVAQSFFQCFFRMPYPKFRIYLKGFYGKPVSYEVMCDKFDTNFNSETGDFDVNVRFIGYLYSFLTDISFDALLAAPYSDYEGKKYWDEQVAAGRFQILDHTGAQMVAMPTLYQMRELFLKMDSESNKDEESTTAEAEHDDHADEIQRLVEIRKLYQSWYATLYGVLCDKYGKSRCHLYKTVGKDADCRGILVLVEQDAPLNMAEEATQFSDEFKRIHDSLYAAVNEYYEKDGDITAVSNVSPDFSEYQRRDLFNRFYADKNNNNQIMYNGLKPNAPITKGDAVSGLLTGEDGKRDEKRYNEIYNDGTNQRICCYYINPDYINVKVKINSLQADANDNATNAGSASINKVNQDMFSKLQYYPSVENFTKVAFAHLETLMHMMFKVESRCSGRTPSQVNVSLGPDGNCTDVRSDSDNVPAFPRVTREITSDGVTKKEDTWVGDFNGGQGFEPEMDIIDGLFNAIDYFNGVEEQMEVLESQKRRMTDVSEGQATVMRYPLTSYDPFLDGNIYSNDDNFMNSASGIIGKVIARMYGILAVSSYMSNETRIPHGQKQSSGSTQLLQDLGALEAENFFYATGGISNTAVEGILLGEDNSSAEDLADKFIKLAVYGNSKSGDKYDGYKDYNGSKSLPWEGQLVTSAIEFKCYSRSGGAVMIPLQNYSFSTDGDEHSAKRHNDIFQKDGCEATNDMAYTRLESCSKFINTYLKSSGWKCGLAFENEHNKIAKLFDSAGNYANTDYRCSDVYEQFLRHARVETYKDEYKSLFRYDESSCFRKMKQEGENSNPTGETALEGYFVTALNDRTVGDCTFTKAYGVGIDDSNLFVADTRHKFVESSENIKKSVMPYRDASFFIMSLWCFDYDKVRDYLSREYTHFFVPKLLALQIGCALSAFKKAQGNSGLGGFNQKAVRTLVVLPDGFSYANDPAKGLDKFLSTMPKAYKVAYIKYFESWCKNNQNAKNVLSMLKSFGDKGFQQNNEKLKSMVTDLMLPVCITRLTSTEKKWDSVKEVGATPSKVFLTSFVDRLRQLHHKGYTTDEEGNSVKLSEETKQTTEVMKMELYRYLKQVHDKWIPATSFEDWQFDKFFQDTKDDSSGHCVYFIDSYYNKIGQKVLISPSEISRLIGVWLNNSDAHTSMLKMLGDMLATSRCMFLCIQNFFDMTRGMKDTFTPLAYNAMQGIKKHPDFVVVYPYEPSKNLNIEKSDYEDDSFMLNDVFYTPIAVTSRGKDENAFYSLPAFGVSYGRQYQSYFKKVDVGMAGAVQTQQAIFMKHQLLDAYRSADTKGRVTTAQNLFDIYTTQSYTCTVTMMGCAWIQPLMYFVLLNVPMFRGSYMIMKVSHSIVPGDMTTTFVGCRMANVGNHIVRNIFSDDQGGGSNMVYQEDLSYEEADIDNDCPYKVYPLEEGGAGDDLSGELSKKVTDAMCFNNTNSKKLVGNTVLDAFSKIVQKESGYQSGNEDYKRCQAMLVATSLYNRLILSRTQKGKDANYSYKNLIFKQGQYDIAGASTMSPTANVKEIVKNIFKQSPSWVLTQYTKTFVSYPDKSAHNRVASEITLDKLQKVFCFMNYKEGITHENKPLLALETLMVCDASKWQSGWKSPDDIQNYKYAGHYFKSGDYGDCWAPSKKDADMNKDLNELLFNAIQKSCDSTKDISIKLSSATTKIDKATYLDITQGNKQTDKLSRVFGLVLNGYYDKFDELYWITNGSDTISDPVMVRIHAKDNSATRQIMICDKSMQGTRKFTNEDAEKARKDGGKYINEDFILSISKKYSDLSENAKDASKELPQFVVNGKFQSKIFESSSVGECAGCETSTGTGPTARNTVNSMYGSTSSYNGKGGKFVNGKIGDWDVAKSVAWIKQNAYSTAKGWCWRHVCCALNYGGIKGSAGGNGGPALKEFALSHGFVIIANGSFQKGSEVKYDSPQTGDLCALMPAGSHRYGHAAMYCGDYWYSDFKQNYNRINGGLGGEFFILRYSGHGGSGKTDSGWTCAKCPGEEKKGSTAKVVC